jgi:DNA-directed RNA polymerase sigma subunit (sigma70/sigma32)
VTCATSSRRSSASDEVTLDALGEALGARAVSHAEIDAMIAALEARGVKVVAPEGGGGEERLRVVVATARALVAELGRKPRPAEIAARSGLSEDEVRRALALAQVIQR